MSKDVQVSPKLSEGQQVLLSAAAERPDSLVAVGDRTPSLARTVGALSKRGLVEEVDASGEQPVWRQDGERRIALRITDAGLLAIGVDPSGRSAAVISAGGPAPASTSVPREGSKQAMVVSLLSRDGGASMPNLMAATGWLPHTTRAALTGLRKRGFAIQRTTGVDGASVYRIEAPAKAKPRSAQRRMREIAASLGG